MKRNCKRGISLLLTVCLVLGIFASSGITLVRAESATTPEPAEETVISSPNLIPNGTFGFMQANVYTYIVGNNTVGGPWTLGGKFSDGVQTIVTNEKASGDGEWSFKFVVDTKNAPEDRSLRVEINFEEALAEDTAFVVSYDSLVSGNNATGQFTAYNGDAKVNTSAYSDALDAKVSTKWATNSKTITVSAGADRIRLQIVAESDADATIYLDNFKIAYTSDPDKNLIPTNASFEDVRPPVTPSILNDVLVLKDDGWTPGNIKHGTASVIADPADFLNGVLELKDTSTTG